MKMVMRHGYYGKKPENKLIMVDISLFKFYKNKRIFITGHTGFKGSWLSYILLLSGAKVFGYSLKSPTNPNLYTILNINKNIISYIEDIRNYDKLLKILKKVKPEIVFHLAAQPIVRESYKKPLYTYEVNIMGTVNLLNACRFISSIHSIVNVTTDKVYLNTGKNILYKEDDKLSGSDPYSNSKSCSDIITFGFKNSFFKSKYSPALSTARSGNVIGGGDFGKYRIIPDCVRSLEKKKPVIIRNPEGVRPYQFIVDCLYGYLLLAKKQYFNKEIEGSYNFGPDKMDFIKNIELVKIFDKNIGNKLKIKIKKEKIFYEDDILKLDNKKSKEILGWQPQINLKKAIELTANWYKAYLIKEDLNKIIESQIKNFFNL